MKRLNVKELLEIKENVKKELSKKVDIHIAKSDHHALRPPRPCGITIHVGIGCPNACIYCYIGDMGFPVGTTTPYHLSPEELVYALAANRYFFPSRLGTFVAFGSVTEPFVNPLKEKTFSYMYGISQWLGNPIQFSTKMYLSNEDVKKLLEIEKISGSRISPLITIITIGLSHILEPKAPSIDKRLETMRNLKSNGINPVLFLRPIIPGVTDLEMEEIMRKANQNGAIGVVIGSLRVTSGILKRLKSSGIDIKEITRRLKHKVKEHKQISVPSKDLKKKAINTARTLGLIVFPSACCANALTNDVACAGCCFLKNMCLNCPNNCITKLPEITEDDVFLLFDSVARKKPKSIRVLQDAVEVKIGNVDKTSLRVISSILRRRVKIL